jgi:hypothetical protein
MIINDDYMVYNSNLHRYTLTIKYCSDVLGLDIENRVKSQGAPNATAVIESRLRLISSEIYGYLYAHNNARTIQWIIAQSKNARDIIQEALGAQVLYVFTNGDLGFVADKKDNESIICPQAKAILNNTEVVETGCTLTYCGAYRFIAPSYEKGGY